MLFYMPRCVHLDHPLQFRLQIFNSETEMPFQNTDFLFLQPLLQVVPYLYVQHLKLHTLTPVILSLQTHHMAYSQTPIPQSHLITNVRCNYQLHCNWQGKEWVCRLFDPDSTANFYFISISSSSLGLKLIISWQSDECFTMRTLFVDKIKFIRSAIPPLFYEPFWSHHMLCFSDTAWS